MLPRHAWASCLLVILTASLVQADGLIVVDPSVHIAPVRPGHPRFAPLVVEFHHVSVTIRDQVAVTRIEQSFRNPSDQRLEGTYLFPVPAGAQIDKFVMDVDGKMMPAELLDAAKARHIYEQIVRKARDPALLEYVGRDLFKVRIFPIEPRSSKRVNLQYTQLLAGDGGLVSYTYPLNTEKFSAAPIASVSVKIELATTRPIKNIYSPSHALEIKRHDERHAVVGFEAANVRPDTDLQLLFSTQRPGNSDIDLSLLTWNDALPSGAGRSADGEGGYFILLASAPWRLPEDRIVAKDVMFVLDTSGSMAGPKLEQAKRALTYCVENLNDADRFQIARFSTEAETLFRNLTPVSADTRRQARQFIDNLRAVGGTAIDEALTRALTQLATSSDSTRPGYIFFLTDGKPTIGPSDENTILANLAKAAGGASGGGGAGPRIFSFGIGHDVNTHLLDKIAGQSRALTQYVLPEEDIEVKVSSFFAKLSSPVLAGPMLDVTNVRVGKLQPAALGDLFEGDQLVVVGRYTGSGPAAITLSGAVAGRPHRITFEGDFAARATEHEFIPRLWATRRVGELLERIRLHGENAELRDEVTQLARQYGIVTPYTAYLIVEDEARRDVPVPMRTLQAPAEDQALRESLGRGYETYSAARSGASAVAGAENDWALKNAPAPATVPAQPADLLRLEQRNRAAFTDAAGMSAERAQRAAGAVTQMQQAQRFVKGRNFFQNDTQWVDANVQAAAGAPRVQVRFNSDEYFAMLKKHPDAAAWLSLGRSVQVLLAGTVYEVVDES